MQAKNIGLFLLSLFVSISYASSSMQKLTILLDGKTNTTHAPLVIAKQQGFFKEQGLDVQFVQPSQETDQSNWLLEGKADIGLTYEPRFIEQVDHGLPLIRIGTLIDKPLNCIVALKRSGIKSLHDLKGKEIASTSNRLTNVILTNMLTNQGISSKDVKLVRMQQNLPQALLSNKVEAISGTMRNFEVPMLEKNGFNLVVFFPEEHGIPNYSEIVFISNITNAHDPRYPRFLAAVKKAVRYLDEHPQEAWTAFTKQYPPLNTTLNREYWFATLPYFAEDPAGFNHDEWKNFANFMQQNKLISKIQPISRYTI